MRVLTPGRQARARRPVAGVAAWLRGLPRRVRERWDLLMGAEPYQDDDDFISEVGPFLPWDGYGHDLQRERREAGERAVRAQMEMSG
jgi:hypothetical protein